MTMRRSGSFSFCGSAGNHYSHAWNMGRRQNSSHNSNTATVLGFGSNFGTWSWKSLMTWRMTFLIFFMPISHGGELDLVGRERAFRQQPPGGGGLELSGLYPGPYFDLERNHENVSAHVGTHAYLPCYVKQLGNKSVSWIRKSDAHIVTVDRFTFIADDRFQVLPLGESWTLQIKYVQPRDAGIYECQISTEPKLAFRIELNVLIPSIRMGSKEENMFVWEGSQVQLRCIVQNTNEENLGKLNWYKNGVHMDKLDPFSRNVVFKSKMEGASIVEIASFSSVYKSDGGNYTCSLSPVGSATVTLHVLNGENPAAMHHGKGIPSMASSGSVIFQGSSCHRLASAMPMSIFSPLLTRFFSQLCLVLIPFRLLLNIS